MKQLILNWTNDKTVAKMPEFPLDVAVKTFSQLDNALAAWQDIMQYISLDGKLDTSGDFYQKVMIGKYPNYNEDMCYFLLVKGQPVATLTVICDYTKKQGYIHMVACKPEFRGMGLGRLLNEISVYTLKREGMETAYLTTDDERIPAIKSYLRAGFQPDFESEADYKERWAKIYQIIGI